MLDSTHLQRADVERAERKQKAWKWRGELPVALYSREEVEVTLTRFDVVEHGKRIELVPGIHLEFRNAGHILGSAIAVMDIAEDSSKSKRCVFSGDYGDRLHRSLQETEDELVEVIVSTMDAHGNVVMQ